MWKAVCGRKSPWKNWRGRPVFLWRISGTCSESVLENRWPGMCRSAGLPVPPGSFWTRTEQFLTLPYNTDSPAEPYSPGPSDGIPTIHPPSSAPRPQCLPGFGSARGYTVQRFRGDGRMDVTAVLHKQINREKKAEEIRWKNKTMQFYTVYQK